MSLHFQMRKLGLQRLNDLLKRWSLNLNVWVYLSCQEMWSPSPMEHRAYFAAWALFSSVCASPERGGNEDGLGPVG